MCKRVVGNVAVKDIFTYIIFSSFSDDYFPNIFKADDINTSFKEKVSFENGSLTAIVGQDKSYKVKGSFDECIFNTFQQILWQKEKLLIF